MRLLFHLCEQIPTCLFKRMCCVNTLKAEINQGERSIHR